MSYPMTRRSGWVPTVSGSQTTAPTIDSVSDNGGDTVTWRVKNNDAASATCISECNDSTPDAYSGVLASLATHYKSQVFGILMLPVTIYATAEASGKSISTVTSYYYEGV